MAKKEVAPTPRVKKVKPVRAPELLKVSKESKIYAAFAELRGVNKRAYIKTLGEAEANFKLNGRLILSQASSK